MLQVATHASKGEEEVLSDMMETRIRLLVLCVCADSSLLPVIHKKLRCLMIYDVLSEEVRYTILTSFSFLQNHNMNIGIGLHSFIHSILFLFNLRFMAHSYCYR